MFGFVGFILAVNLRSLYLPTAQKEQQNNKQTKMQFNSLFSSFGKFLYTQGIGPNKN